MQPSTLKNLKAMFFKEHIVEISYIGGMRYFLKKTGEEISRDKALKFKEGNY